MTEMAVEIVRFETDPNSEEAMLAARPPAVDAIRSSCPGLIDARLFRGEQPGAWIDVWFWDNLDDARHAAQVAASLPAAGHFFSFITSPPAMDHGTLAAADLHD